MTRVLILEDEVDLAELVQQFVLAEGMDSHILNDGREAVSWIQENSPDVVLLDIMLPSKDGMQICKEVRNFSDVPIIMASAKIDEIDRLNGFEAGATDYICKPYSSKEVIARIKSLVKLYHRDQVAGEGLILDVKNHHIHYRNKDIELSHIEFKLLSLLYHRPGRIYTREQIISEVYSDYRTVSERNVDSHIKNLRKKIALLDNGHEYIRAIYGAGYKYENRKKLLH
ncbi:MAG: response regulator [Pseudomonadales bacterium]|nr:response regulator [Pseudomonadales bacterium]